MIDKNESRMIAQERRNAEKRAIRKTNQAPVSRRRREPIKGR